MKIFELADENDTLPGMRFILAGLLLVSAAAFGQTPWADLTPVPSDLPMCQPAYYSKIVDVGHEFYLDGKQKIAANLFDGSSGASFVSVACGKMPGYSDVWVDLRVLNSTGVGRIQTFAVDLPIHIQTEASLSKVRAEESAKEAKAAVTREYYLSVLRSARVGKTIVFGLKHGTIPSGVAVRVEAVSYIGSSNEPYRLEVSRAGAGMTANFESLADLEDCFSGTYSPAKFARFSLADKAAIREGTWRYGMSRDVLGMLWGSPTHVNDYDGEEQVVYTYGDSESIFYFNRAGLLTNHTSSR